MSTVASAVVWIDNVDTAKEADQLGAANATASRLELMIVDIVRGQQNAPAALTAARRVGVLIVPDIESCVPDLLGIAELVETARREGWRCLLLEFGADSLSPSGTMVIEQFRLLAEALKSDVSLPVPMAGARRRVASGGEQFFRASGVVDAASYLAALERLGGHVLAEDTKLLDWGAGSGRLTRQLAARTPKPHITAVDIDRAAIEWLSTNIPVDRALTIDIEPPLPFADDTFDVAIAHSVFTHLDSDAQDAWLAELARVTRPGGTVLASTHGPTALQWHLEHPLVSLAGAIGAAMPSLGFFFWRGEGWEAHFHDGYHTAFHDPEYVRTHWAQWFDVVEVLPAHLRGRQDLVVLRPAKSSLLQHLPGS